MIRFAVCDDNPQTTGEIDSLIMALNPRYGRAFEISVFFSGEDFLEYLNDTGEVFDIVIMDIEMKGIGGVEAAVRFRENAANDRSLLIFVSEHGNLREIIDLHAFCFIPKPIKTEEFRRKLDRAIKSVLRQKALPESPSLIIHINRRELHVPLNTIMYLASDARRIRLKTESETYVYYGVLNDEEKKFPTGAFARIHQSYLISFSHVAEITAKEVLMKDGEFLSISGKYRESVKAAHRRFKQEDYLLHYSAVL